MHLNGHKSMGPGEMHPGALRDDVAGTLLLQLKSHSSQAKSPVTLKMEASFPFLKGEKRRPSGQLTNPVAFCGGVTATTDK